MKKAEEKGDMKSIRRGFLEEAIFISRRQMGKTAGGLNLVIMWFS